MFNIYKRRTRVLSLSLIYIGVFLILFPSLFLSKGAALTEMFFDLSIQVGQALLVAGVVWLIIDSFYSRLETAIGERQLLYSKGIKEVRMVTPANIKEIFNYLSNSSHISIQVNLLDANRNTLELVNNLEELKLRQKVQLLVAGARKDGLKDLASSTTLSFETKMLLELLAHTMIPENDPTIEVRWLSTPLPHTVVIGERVMLLLITYSPKGGDTMLLSIDMFTELAEQYRRQFFELWERSEKD